MSDGNYILDKTGNPVAEPDIIKWAQWFETAKRHVADDRIDQVRISTIFLGIDHSFGEGEPVLFETMIFGGEHDQYTERYCNKAAALAGHDQAVALVKDNQ